MTNLFFATPWWLPTLLAGVGVILFWNANKRQEAKLRNVGLACIGAAMLVMGVSYLVDTDLEKCIKNSKQLAYDVEKQDWAHMTSLLDANATVDVQNFGIIYSSRDTIISGVKESASRYGVKNIRILSTESEQVPTIITVRLGVLSDQDAAAVSTVNTGWEIQWRKFDGAWKIDRITNIKIGNTTGENAAGYFRRAR